MKNVSVDDASYASVLVSVVVPVYEIGPYIHKCVDSLLGQSHKNIEIILVDDGSPDDCPKICDEYAKKDTRVRVIHKRNGGLSDARNAGLEIAKGRYIAFVDGDDWVDEGYIEIMLNTAFSKQADVSVCGYCKVHDDGTKANYSPQPCVLSGSSAVSDLLVRPDSYKIVAWNKLYKAALFKDNGITFPKDKIHEDNYTTYKLFACANRVVFTSHPLYHYIQRSDSIMGRGFSKKRLDVLGMFAEAQEFFATKRLHLQDELEAHKLLMTLGLYNDYLKSNKRDSEIGKMIRTELKRLKKSRKNSKISAKHKVLYLLAISSERVYDRVRATYDKMAR